MKSKISPDWRNLVYSRRYVAAPKLDDSNAFTLYNCEDVAAFAPVRPAYLIKVQISVTLLCLGINEGRNVRGNLFGGLHSRSLRRILIVGFTFFRWFTHGVAKFQGKILSDWTWRKASRIMLVDVEFIPPPPPPPPPRRYWPNCDSMSPTTLQRYRRTTPGYWYRPDPIFIGVNSLANIFLCKARERAKGDLEANAQANNQFARNQNFLIAGRVSFHDEFNSAVCEIYDIKLNATS